MQTRLLALGARLRRFWTWWRLVLAAVGAACLAIAVSVDQPVVAVIAAVIAVAPFAVLAGLMGDRLRAHHEQLGALVAGIGGRGGADHETAMHDVGALAALAEQAHRLGAMPGATDLDLVVRLDADDLVASLRFLDDAAAALVSAGCIAVVDATHSRGDELAGAVIARMDRWPGLRLLVDDPPTGDWFDTARATATARQLLPVDVSQPAEADIGAVVELALGAARPEEPWVGARAGAIDTLVLYRRTALDEVGGRLDGDVGARPVELRLADAGYVVDTVAHPGVVAATSVPADAPSHQQVASVGPVRPVRRRLRVDDPHHELRGRVVAVPMAAYHCDELVPLADRLGDQGIAAGLLVADPWQATVMPALARNRHPVFAQPPAGAWLASLAALVVMNDWDAELAPLVDAAAGYGVPTIAKVEGAQDFDDADVPIRRNAYRRAAHVLCQGDNDVAALPGCRTHVVGSSRLERIWAAPPRPLPEHRLAVINLNFTHGVLVDAREVFLRTAIEACERAGIDHVVSAHPHQREGLEGLRLADEPMRHLLRRASVLVSRFSTVPFEAMALGVPFVYHNPHGEQVPTFAVADGAYDISVDTLGLVDALDEAARWEGRGRERCAEFFARQVDIDPRRSSEERTVDVLRAILDEHSRTV